MKPPPDILHVVSLTALRCVCMTHSYQGKVQEEVRDEKLSGLQ